MRLLKNREHHPHLRVCYKRWEGSKREWIISASVERWNGWKIWVKREKRISWRMSSATQTTAAASHQHKTWNETHLKILRSLLSSYLPQQFTFYSSLKSSYHLFLLSTHLFSEIHLYDRSETTKNMTFHNIQTWNETRKIRLKHDDDMAWRSSPQIMVTIGLDT